MFKKTLQGLMPDMGKLTDQFEAKFGELRDRLDTIIARLDTLIEQGKSETGGVIGTVLAVIGGIVVVIALILFAVCNDDNDHQGQGLGRIELASYRGGPDCYQYGDCRDDDRRDYDNDGEDNRRGGISPGPFDRSPVDIRDNRLVVCFPFSRCDGKDGDNGGEQPPMAPASLFPPTPAGIRDFVTNTIKAGLDMGQTFATVTIKFVEDLMVGIA